MISIVLNPIHLYVKNCTLHGIFVKKEDIIKFKFYRLKIFNKTNVCLDAKLKNVKLHYV